MAKEHKDLEANLIHLQARKERALNTDELTKANEDTEEQDLKN
jgi:hypothetical protein